MFWISIVSSFFIVAFGQPARLGFLGFIAASCGFALFWRGMLQLSSRREKFWLACIWFTGVQLIQLSWMSSTQYMGLLILPVYLGVCLILGVQFGLLSLFVSGSMSIRNLLTACGMWVFFEWIRLFVCTGFTWNPVGLALSCSTYSLQAASFFGIYGLSFWVILTNLVGLQAIVCVKNWKMWGSFCVIALLPYLAGMMYLHSLDSQSDRSLRALLVQTAMLPEQKDYYSAQAQAFVPLVEQWSSILHNIEQALQKDPGKIDLIVLPEGALPYGAYRYIYDLEMIEEVWQQIFGLMAFADLPPLQSPQARWEREGWKVTNAYWAQALAIRYGADVIIGLDDEQYNAAFFFRPDGTSTERYEKRVLVPVSEYVPLGQMRFLSAFIAEQFGITQFFNAGKYPKLFQSKIPLAVSICYEETYGEIVREGRLAGAQLFVNLTNDAWFPSSLLAQQHFDHGIVRSVENGVSVLRACNTGVTGGVDRFGRVIRTLPVGDNKKDAVIIDIPISSHCTWYTWWGDTAILSISGLFLALYLLQLRIYQKRNHCPKFADSDTFFS